MKPNIDLGVQRGSIIEVGSLISKQKAFYFCQGLPCPKCGQVRVLARWPKQRGLRQCPECLQLGIKVPLGSSKWFCSRGGCWVCVYRNGRRRRRRRRRLSLRGTSTAQQRQRRIACRGKVGRKEATREKSPHFARENRRDFQESGCGEGG